MREPVRWRGLSASRATETASAAECMAWRKNTLRAGNGARRQEGHAAVESGVMPWRRKERQRNGRRGRCCRVGGGSSGRRRRSKRSLLSCPQAAMMSSGRGGDWPPPAHAIHAKCTRRTGGNSAGMGESYVARPGTTAAPQIGL